MKGCQDWTVSISHNSWGAINFGLHTKYVKYKCLALLPCVFLSLFIDVVTRGESRCLIKAWWFLLMALEKLHSQWSACAIFTAPFEWINISTTHILRHALQRWPLLSQAWITVPLYICSNVECVGWGRGAVWLVWVLRWWFRLDFWLNPLLQTGHL